jgi:urease accessory protein
MKKAPIIITRLQISLFLFLSLSSHISYAHGFYGGSGWLHPLTGVDHMMAMIAVGAWSAQLGGRAIWYVPGAFLLSMLVGGICGYSHVFIPYTEYGVSLSVLILGIVIAVEYHIAIFFAAIAVAVFGICHGYAHGAEIPLERNKITYTIGFLATTAGLHIFGATGAMLMLSNKNNGRLYLRGCGILCAIIGVFLILKLK